MRDRRQAVSWGLLLAACLLGGLRGKMRVWSFSGGPLCLQQQRSRAQHSTAKQPKCKHLHLTTWHS